AVFGAYVAMSAWLPFYYESHFDVTLATAGLLAATFIFPASLLRPLGGWMSDRWGARKVMYLTFGLMLFSSGVLMMPNGHIVIDHSDGRQTEHLAYEISLFWVVFLVFILGVAMGIGKAAVYKHIPEYYPDNVGSVGGLVGMLGGLGGFFLPPLFAYTEEWSGFPTSMFFIIFLLTVVCTVWMHVTILRMHEKHAPEISRDIDDSTVHASR
ncbi:MAG: MFS transporter, partial [Mobilicoccus sp.]|nr:MFS transporter [Mobilicoccus sp.]